MPGRAGHSVPRRQFAAVTELFDHVGHAVLRRGERGYAGSLNESGSARDRVADQARRRPDQWLRHGRITQRHPVAPRPGVGRGASQPPAGPRPGDPAGGMFGALMIVRNSSSFGPSATSARLTATSISLLRASSAATPRESRRCRDSAFTPYCLVGSLRCRRPRGVPASKSRARRPPGARPNGRAAPLPVPEPGQQTRLDPEAREAAPGAALGAVSSHATANWNKRGARGGLSGT